jgi:hypothetical protein
MELLNIVTARATWLFDISELNPRGKSIFPELLEWLAEEYHFQKFPKSITDLDETKGLAFSRGTFQAREEFFVDVELKVYNDGLIASSWSSTRNSEAFLEDVAKSAVREFGLTFRPEIIRRKLYLSQLNFTSNRQLIGINPKLSCLSEKISDLVPGKNKQQFEVGGITVSTLQGISRQSVVAFQVERKLNTSPEENKFYSTAPLQTDDHLAVLDWFEQNLME